MEKLSDCNINDQFFDSLKSDYPEFEKWYLNKAYQGKKHLHILTKRD